MIRISMPKGHAQLNLAGVTYNPDAEGAFLVPDEHVPDLIRVHGGSRAPSIQDLQNQVDFLQGQINTISQQKDALEGDLAKAQANLKSAQDAQAARITALKNDAPAAAPSDGTDTAGSTNPGTVPRLKIATSASTSG